MNDEIRYQYDDLQQIARRFRGLTDNADKWLRWTTFCLRQMENGVWTGKGSAEYKQELEFLMIPALRRLSGVLGDTAWLIDKAGDIMREAEQIGAQQFNAGGKPLVVDFSALGFFAGGSYGGSFGGWTAGEIDRLGDAFGVAPHRPGVPQDDLEAANSIDSDEMLDKRYGGGFFGDAESLFGKKQTNPDLPLTLPGQNGAVVTPPWYTEHDEADGGLNGAKDAPVMVVGAGDHTRLTGDIAKTSQALGGARVTGVFAIPAEDDVLRGPGSVAVASATVVSPAVTAMMDWIRAHPGGLFVLPPSSAAPGIDALNALAAEGFDLSQLNVITFDANLVLPDGPHYRAIVGFPDLKV